MEMHSSKHGKNAFRCYIFQLRKNNLIIIAILFFFVTINSKKEMLVMNSIILIKLIFDDLKSYKNYLIENNICNKLRDCALH